VPDVNEEVSGNPDLPNKYTDALAGWLGVLFPGVDVLANGTPEQLHQLLLLGGWKEPRR
jgi:hypothetical protein